MGWEGHGQGLGGGGGGSGQMVITLHTNNAEQAASHTGHNILSEIGFKCVHVMQCVHHCKTCCVLSSNVQVAKNHFLLFTEATVAYLVFDSHPLSQSPCTARYGVSDKGEPVCQESVMKINCQHMYTIQNKLRTNFENALTF